MMIYTSYSDGEIIQCLWGACGVHVHHEMGVLMGVCGGGVQCWAPGVLQRVLVGFS